MIRKFIPLVLPLGLGLLASCQSSDSAGSQENSQEHASFSPESYRNYVTTLASDEMEGRKPFTEGERKTLAYLEEQSRALGLEPGNGDSYLQEVPLMELSSFAEPEMIVQGRQDGFTLTGREDYVVWARSTAESVSLEKDELVFAGFGIVAPEYNWNDYEGMDVAGKVVVVLVSDPGFYANDSTFFNGSAMTYYGRWTYKYEEAARQGAKACLIIHDTAPAGYGFNVVQNNWNSAKQYLDLRGRETNACDIEGWLSHEAAGRLFEASGSSLSDAMERANSGSFTPRAMNLQVSTSIRVTTNYNKSYNFLAAIPGTERADESIIYTAHWDHLGIGRPDAAGDSIFNGAVDNASGVAGLLEVAKAFKNLEEEPERTIVFLAVTAEEQGLLGSAWYAQNPVYPIAKTVANINIDMLNPYGETKDIVVIGQGKSELEELLQEEAEKTERYIVREPTPEAGLYYRSDHFNFAKEGVPALFTGAGIDHAVKGISHGTKLQEDFTAKYYHKPSDEVTPEWDMEGIVADLKLLYSLGHRLAFSNEWPAWKEGSEFKAIREASAGQR